MTTRGRSRNESRVARDLYSRGFDGWSESHRVAVNLDTIFRDLAGDRSHRDPLTMLAKMGRLTSSR